MSSSFSTSALRVRGPLDILLDQTDFDPIDNLPDRFQALADNPQTTFTPFHFPLRDGSRSYALWIKSPQDLPGVFGERMKTVWHGSLGAMILVNPQHDTYAIVHVHGAARVPWSIYATPDNPAPWHADGGMMGFEEPLPEAGDMAAVLGALNVTHAYREDGNLNWGGLDPDAQASLIFMAALDLVAGKSVAMTLKHVMIREMFERMGIQAQEPGGAKAILIGKRDEITRRAGLEMVMTAAQKTGLYLSGPDQNMSNADCDFAAGLAPFHWSGSIHSHPYSQGIIGETSYATARGAFAAVQEYLSLNPDLNHGLLIQGTGNVGTEFLKLALASGKQVVGLVDISVANLLRAKKLFEAAGVPVPPLFFDTQAAWEQFSKPDYKKAVQEAVASGLVIANGLEDAFGPTRHPVGVFVPAAGPHPVTPNFLRAFKEQGGHGVIGPTNNVLATDKKGSYKAVALQAVREGIFISNDSWTNMLGAGSSFIEAYGLKPSSLDRMDTVVAQGTAEQLIHFKSGRSPQIAFDNRAKRGWNRLIDQRQAVGGFFKGRFASPQRR